MKIKICVENLFKIQAALDAVKGNAQEHCHIASDVILTAQAFEQKAQVLGLPKAYRKGLKANHGAFIAMPLSYKYQRKVTIINLERGSKDWFLIGVFSDSVFPNESGACDLILTQEQDQIVVDNFRSLYKCE